MKISREMLLDYLNENFGLKKDEIDDSTALFSDGLLDSFSVADLLLFIEEKGELVVEPEEIVFDNLDSISQILAFVEGKCASANG